MPISRRSVTRSCPASRIDCDCRCILCSWRACRCPCRNTNGFQPWSCPCCCRSSPHFGPRSSWHCL